MWNGMVKVGQDRGSVMMWNPETDERESIACYDSEYGFDGWNMGLVALDVPEKERRQLLACAMFDGDETIERAWYVARGIVREGMTVRVVKGRKVKVGTVAEVVRLSEWRDQYGRVRTVYAHFADGQRTSVANLEVVA